MPLEYSVPKALVPASMCNRLICTRITIDVVQNRIHYEFYALDAQGNKVGDLHTEDVFGVDVRAADVVIPGINAGQVYAALKARAYATAQAKLGAGTVS